MASNWQGREYTFGMLMDPGLSWTPGDCNTGKKVRFLITSLFDGHGPLLLIA